MMYATEKEGGSPGAAYTQTFLSKVAAVSAEVFLAVYAAGDVFP